MNYEHDPLHPLSIVTLFDNDAEFIDWLKLGTVDELNEILEQFEIFEELYEHCALIVNVRDDMIIVNNKNSITLL